MDKQAVAEVIACLPSDRTLYRYFPGRYALMLLADHVQSGRSIHALRQSRFAPLLQKPLVRTMLAECGCGVVDRALLDACWPASCETFLLGLACWGEANDRLWCQTSRHGYNLVLQLNFNTGDMAQFARLVANPYIYNCEEHPSCKRSAKRYRETLAWARIDLSLDTDEALIEEVQSDWISYVHWHSSPASALERFLKRYERIWSEATLAAAIWFLRHEIGIRRIFYHDFETGNAMKGLREW